MRGATETEEQKKQRSERERGVRVTKQRVKLNSDRERGVRGKVE